MNYSQPCECPRSFSVHSFLMVLPTAVVVSSHKSVEQYTVNDLAGSPEVLQSCLSL